MLFLFYSNSIRKNLPYLAFKFQELEESISLDRETKGILVQDNTAKEKIQAAFQRGKQACTAIRFTDNEKEPF